MSDLELMLEVPENTPKIDIENIVGVHNYTVLNGNPVELQNRSGVSHLYFIKGPSSDYLGLKKEIDSLKGYTLWSNPKVGPCVFEDN